MEIPLTDSERLQQAAQQMGGVVEQYSFFDYGMYLIIQARLPGFEVEINELDDMSIIIEEHLMQKNLYGPMRLREGDEVTITGQATVLINKFGVPTDYILGTHMKHLSFPINFDSRIVVMNGQRIIVPPIDIVNVIDDGFAAFDQLYDEEDIEVAEDEGGKKRPRRSGKTYADSIGHTYLTKLRVNFHILREAVQGVDPHILNRRSFALLTDRLVSIKYSDLAQIDTFISSQYGICLLEALEYIRSNGTLMDLFNETRAKENGRLLNQLTFCQNVRDLGMDQQQISTILQGNIVSSMVTYKQMFPELNFYLYVCQRDILAWIDIDDDFNIKQRSYSTLCDEHWKPYDESILPDWFIVYERMHVVPLKKKQFIKFVQTYQHQLKSIVHMRRPLKKTDNDAVSKIKMQWQNKHHREMKTYYMPKSIDESSIRLKLVEFQQFKPHLTYEQICLDFNFRLEDTNSVDIGIMKQKMKLQRVGLCMMDAETVKDNSQDRSLYGNTRPFMLCIYGYLFVDVKMRHLNLGQEMNDYIFEEEEETEQRTRVGKIRVELTFVGFQCYDLFVEWLMQNAVIRLAISSKRLAHPSCTNPSDYLREYQNYFFAHNGTRFDFKFLIDKLSKFCEIEITGTKSQMKKMKFKNVHFIDSYLILPFSLKMLCKKFNPENKKFPYDIEGITLSNWHEREVQVQKYCMMDCKSLYDIMHMYLEKRCTTYLNNTSFPKKLIPMTQSQAALDEFQSAFLEETLQVFVDTLPFERASYLGGCVQVYKPKCKYGCTFDITSSYPCCMHNDMPFAPVKHIDEFGVNRYIFHYRVPAIYVIQDSPLFDACTRGDHLQNTTLYEVSFSFPKECKYPSLLIKDEQTGNLVCPITSGVQRHWIWGIQLNIALQQQGALIIVHRYIEYTPKKIFNKFITTYFQMRKIAQQQGDSVSDFLLKLGMNSCYGKFGQNTNPMTLHGTLDKIEDFIAEQKKELGDDFTVVSVEPLISVNHQFYELKYVLSGQLYCEIGSMVRFASYITAFARANLFRAIDQIGNTVERQTNSMCICYTDTDSIAVDLSGGFNQQEKNTLDQLFQVHENLSQQLSQLKERIETIDKYLTLLHEQLLSREEEQKYYDQFDQWQNEMNVSSLIVISPREFKLQYQQNAKQLEGQLNHNLQLIQTVYDNNQYYQNILNIVDNDPRDLSALGMSIEQQIEKKNELPKVPLVDNGEICGAFKKEKFIWKSYYLGAKFYAMKGIEIKEVCMQDMCKMKGIRQSLRVFEDYRKMYKALDKIDLSLNNASLIIQYAKDFEQQQFRVLDTGVRIFNQMKIIMPTLSKRHFYKDNNGKWVSRAFTDMIEFFSYNQKCKLVNAEVKGILKQYLAEKLRQRLLNVESNEQLNNEQQKLKDRCIEQTIRQQNNVEKIVQTYIDYEDEMNKEMRETQLVSLKTVSALYFRQLVKEHYFEDTIRQKELIDMVTDSLFEKNVTYCSFINSKNCKKINYYGEVITKIFFLHKLCNRITNNSNCFISACQIVKKKIEKIASQQKQYFSLNEILCRFAFDEFDAVCEHMHPFLAKTIRYELDFSYVETQDGQKLFKRVRRVVDQELHDQVQSLIKKKEKEIDALLSHKKKNRGPYQQYENIRHFFKVRIALVNYIRAGRYKEIYNYWHRQQQELQNKSLYKPLLYTLRWLMGDDKLFFGCWETENNYSKLGSTLKRYLDQLRDRFFNIDVIQMNSFDLERQLLQQDVDEMEQLCFKDMDYRLKEVYTSLYDERVANN